MTNISVIGVGALGRPIARRLIKGGCDVLAADHDADVRARADREGIPVVPAAASAISPDVVVVSVATGDQLLDAVRAVTSRRSVAGESWLIVSTVGPDHAREAGERLTTAGAEVVDAPVTGGVTGAESGTLRFLAAGRSSTIASLHDVLSLLGEVRRVGNRVGDGQATKLVNQLCSSIHLVAAAEAVALASKLGLDTRRTIDVIRGGSGASWFLDERGPRMADQAEMLEVQTRLAILAKDNALVEREAEHAGAHIPLLKAAARQYAQAAEWGLLENDDSEIIKTYVEEPQVSGHD